METMISHNFYKDVPGEQLKLFLDFHKNHPYSTITFQNKELKYISSGEGEKTLVFLHGALVRPDMWFFPILELEKKFRIIAPLFLPQMMGAQEAADFVRSILKQEYISKAVIIGYSYGGGVAQYLAEKYPEMVDKLVLSHTGITGREGTNAQIERTRKVIRLLPFLLTKKKLKDRIEFAPTSDWNDLHKAYFLEINATLTKPLFMDYLASMHRFVDETKDFPVDERNWNGETVLLGTRSDRDAFEHFDNLMKLYPNSESYIFYDSGGHHMLFLFPEKYSRVLSRFLE
jgi:pimeloyl-ACP methyl ester carboxylesterase